MKVTILGNNSALPAFGRHPTAQGVSVYGEVVLFDCGEGTQVQMQRFGLKWRRLQHIFISHLHGDHYFGLPGLINSMSLLGRTLPLHVYAPAPLEGLLQQIQAVSENELCYPFHFHPLKEGVSELLVENESFSVKSFPVEHWIPCDGFLLERKTRGRRLLPDRCREFEIPAYFYDRLKQGEDYIRQDGTVIANELVTDVGPSPKKYAFCADTLYTDSFLKYIENVDAMYHECTYLHEDAEKAADRYHSTARQAAEIAIKANAGMLLLGHFSSRYRDLQPFLEEASQVFPNVQLAMEGSAYEI